MPKKKLELLTLPFYILFFLTLLIMGSNLSGAFIKGDLTSSKYEALPSEITGIIFCALAIILFVYANFFEKSFPSCLTIKENKQLSGIYKYIRHPSFYIFFFISFGSAFILANSVIFLLAVINHICLYFYYMIEEKQFKKDNSYYADYLKKTNRFLPSF